MRVQIKIVVLGILLCNVAGFVHAQALSTMVSKYMTNQKKVLTFIGQGNMLVEMSGRDGKLLKSVSTPLQIYMKYPNLFKLTMSGDSSIEMMQKGDQITQKIPGTDTVITQKVTANSDMFKKYFGYTFDNNIDDTLVEKVETIQEAGKTFTCYRIKVVPVSTENTKKQSITIDYTELFFDENSMLVRSIIYSGGKEYIRTVISYVNKNDIWVANQLCTVTESQGAKISSSINYTVLSINTPIADKEFEIK